MIHTFRSIASPHCESLLAAFCRTQLLVFSVCLSHHFDSQHITFSYDNLTVCSRRNQTVTLRVTGFIVFSYLQGQKLPQHEDQAPFPIHDGLSCLFNFTSTDLHVKVRFKEQTCSLQNYIEVQIQNNATQSYKDIRNGCEKWESPLFIQYTSLSNVFVFKIVIRNITVPYAIQLNVTSTYMSYFEVQWASPRMGVLQTQRWHPEAGITYDAMIPNTVFRALSISSGHVLMVSFLYVFLPEIHWVFINWRGSTGEQKRTFIKDTNAELHPWLMREGVLYVVTDRDDGPVRRPGFRLLFTVFQEKSRPVRISRTKWNCTDSNWKGLHGLEPHLACNFLVQCSDGRDEDGCGYTRCHQEGFQVGGQCYFLLWQQGLTQYKANRLCERQGAQLASIKPHDNVTALLGLLWRRHPFTIIIGLTSPTLLLPWMYRQTLIWVDRTLSHAVYTVPRSTTFPTETIPRCGRFDRTLISNDNQNMFASHSTVSIQLYHCPLYMDLHVFLCKVKMPVEFTWRVKSVALHLNDYDFSASFIACPFNHTTYLFLACDVHSACWAKDGAKRGTDSNSWGRSAASSCSFPEMTSLPSLFSCLKGSDGVSYTFVCDHRQDCSDNSDESFCDFPACQEQQCDSSRQCYTSVQFCDGQADCINWADEATCPYLKTEEESYVPFTPPAVIDFVKNGSTTITPFPYVQERQSSQFHVCPNTHYQCSQNGYCLPTYTRCNGFYDCPYHEDEAGCDSYTCPGHYRCFASHVCLHPNHVCDGIYQCPRSEDELLCNLHCPHNCMCHGLAFTCPRPFPAEDYSELRYLNASGSGMTLSQLAANTMLIFLSLCDCDQDNVTSVTLPNLITLDLSFNRLASIPFRVLRRTYNLKTLVLSNNPIMFSLPNNINKIGPFKKIRILDFSHTNLYNLDQQFSALFPGVIRLNLSHCGTQSVTGQGFQPMRNLQVLDMKGCPMTEINKELLQGLDQLHTVYADNYKLCCVATLLPDVTNCQAPKDEISSCQDLLKSNTYRVCLIVFSCLALIGNGVSFVFRLFSLQRSGSQGFSVFVLHLCVSDFLMGIYLSMIGAADVFYKNRYVWDETTWRHSVSCRLAGFLSLISCEVSAFIICLITLDRFLVVHFPLSFLHFEGWSAQLITCLSWIIGFILAVFPLLPNMVHWEFYSQTEICIPLPITRKTFAGHTYSFGIMIVLNFILFLLIAFGQIAIYSSIQLNKLKHGRSTHGSQDTDIARRLFTVAMSDFLCWFPVGLLGLLASQGIPVSGGLNVAVAIVVMPLNSALNPFLYTINILLQRREQRKEEQFQKWMESRGKSLEH